MRINGVARQMLAGWRNAMRMERAWRTAATAGLVAGCSLFVLAGASWALALNPEHAWSWVAPAVLVVAVTFIASLALPLDWRRVARDFDRRVPSSADRAATLLALEQIESLHSVEHAAAEEIRAWFCRHPPPVRRASLPAKVPALAAAFVLVFVALQGARLLEERAGREIRLEQAGRIDAIAEALETAEGIFPAGYSGRAELVELLREESRRFRTRPIRDVHERSLRISASLEKFFSDAEERLFPGQIAREANEFLEALEKQSEGQPVSGNSAGASRSAIARALAESGAGALRELLGQSEENLSASGEDAADFARQIVRGQERLGELAANCSFGRFVPPGEGEAAGNAIGSMQDGSAAGEVVSAGVPESAQAGGTDGASVSLPLGEGDEQKVAGDRTSRIDLPAPDGKREVGEVAGSAPVGDGVPSVRESDEALPTIKEFDAAPVFRREVPSGYRAFVARFLDGIGDQPDSSK